MRLLFMLCCLLVGHGAHAWGAAGHRLVACLAWEQMTASAQQEIAALLARHPEHARWQRRASGGPPCALFAEASTWPDDIKQDRRFHDDAAPAERARHRDWHYVDLDHDGRIVRGGLARQLPLLGEMLAGAPADAAASALPWLAHLLADAHQPLHVGRDDDQGGNAVAIEIPAGTGRPADNLHALWDELPGPPWLRGSRLAEQGERLRRDYRPAPGDSPETWLGESHALLARIYPAPAGTSPVKIDADYLENSRRLAEQRLVDAGRRLAVLLQRLLAARVSRETAATPR